MMPPFRTCPVFVDPIPISVVAPFKPLFPSDPSWWVSQSSPDGKLPGRSLVYVCGFPLQTISAKRWLLCTRFFFKTFRRKFWADKSFIALLELPLSTKRLLFRSFELEIRFFPKKSSNSSQSFLAFLRFPVSETYPKVSPPLCPISNFQSTNRNLTFSLFFSYLMN